MTAPQNALGGVVPLDLVLARTDDVAVLVPELTAYAGGFSLELAVVWRGPPSGWEELRRRQMFLHRPASGAGDDGFRLEIQFAEGAQARFLEHGGSGSDSRSDRSLWISPLPPEGPLTLVCEWPAEGIPRSRAELDAVVVREAAARSQLLWGEHEEGLRRGGSVWQQSFGFRRSEEEDA